MEIIIKTSPKEIADLVLEIQDRKENPLDYFSVAEWVKKIMEQNPGLFTGGV